MDTGAVVTSLTINLTASELLSRAQLLLMREGLAARLWFLSFVLFFFKHIKAS